MSTKNPSLKTLQFFVFSIFYSISILAQQPVEFAKIEKLPYSDVNDLISKMDDDGTMFIYYFTQSRSYFKVYSPTGDLLNEVDYFHNYQPEILGITYTDNDFWIYYQVTSVLNHTTFSALKMSKSISEPVLVEKIPLLTSSKEKALHYFDSEDKLYFLSFINKTERLIVRTFKEDKVLDVKEIESKMPLLYEHFKKSETKFISSNNTHSIYAGQFQDKAFLFEDYIIYLFEGHNLPSRVNNNQTEVLMINMKEGTSSYSMIFTPDSEPSEENNTFIIDHYLARLTLARKHFDLTFYDLLNSNKIVKQHRIGEGNDFYLNNGPIKKEGVQTSLFDDNNSNIQGTSNILNKLNKGTPSISIRKLANDQVHLLIGSYFIQNQSGGGMMYTPGGSFSTPGGSFSTGGSWSYAPGSYGSGSGVSTYFETSLTYPSFEKTTASYINKKLAENYLEKVEKGKEIIGRRTTYRSNNRELLGYVNVDQSTLYLLYFE